MARIRPERSPLTRSECVRAARRLLPLLRAGATLVVCSLLSPCASADGSTIDRVYLPYVTALEHEIEYRALVAADDDVERNGRVTQRLGYGAAINERWFAELYAIVDEPPGLDTRFAGTEAELIWQATEQGEYGVDVGVLMEVERRFNPSVWEAKPTLLVTRNFGRWSATANFGLEVEWGSSVHDEIDTTLAAQLRYRWHRQLEPAVELYSGENTLGLGPVLTGLVQLAPRRRAAWQLGGIVGLENGTPDVTVRAQLEYEF